MRSQEHLYSDEKLADDKKRDDDQILCQYDVEHDGSKLIIFSGAPSIFGLTYLSLSFREQKAGLLDCMSVLMAVGWDDLPREKGFLFILSLLQTVANFTLII
jgi:hypothetical protein